MQGADGHDHDHEHGSHDDHDDHDHDHEEDEHDSDEVEYDEHIWTSPKNAVVLCRAVCDAICKADPANEDFYRANCDDYCAQIEALDARFADLCASTPHKLLVFADRFPMLYFCREFGLDYRAAFHGCSGDTEPSLATIKYLIDKVEDEDIPVVYTIDFGTKKIAAVVSECTGAAVDTLYSMQTVSRADFDAGETYLTLMERNYEALRKGLNRMNESPSSSRARTSTLGYEHKPLLEHLTLTVRAGDYLCIVGENGSGKSTLLRSLLGLLSPLAGKIDCPAQREGRSDICPSRHPRSATFPQRSQRSCSRAFRTAARAFSTRQRNARRR